MATAEQLKAIRKKYRLGEFRGSRKVYKQGARSFSMARKRRSKGRRRSSSMLGSGVWGVILGAGLYVVFEQYLENKIPLSEPFLSFAELGVGLWLSKKSGVMGNLGKTAVVINSYQLIKYYLGATMGGSPTTSMFAYN